jgi:NAD(P)-dependent dehydrogenase (short-subunit alcohol dehydrogenase family)
MAGRVSGKVALITGGGSGIGRATAITFAREGAKVAVADYNRAGGEQTVRMIKDAGGEASFIEANVAIAKQAEAMVARTVEIYGRLDCAFNNAGIEGEMGGNIADCSEENWGRIIAINLTGVFLCMKYEIPQMLKHGGGSIVNTASAAGLIGLPGGTA